jgi:hypothetical protein
VVGAVLAILAVVPWWLPRLTSTVAALLAVTACALACWSFWRVGWLGKRMLLKVLWTSEGEWRLFDRSGASWLATLHPSSQAMGPFLWLRFTSEYGPRELLLFGNDLAPTLRRRMVTRLRLEAHQGRSGAHGTVEAP